ncbi:MAG TPA: hypothetical protein VF433_07700 [Cellvibrio sp.]
MPDVEFCWLAGVYPSSLDFLKAISMKRWRTLQISVLFAMILSASLTGCSATNDQPRVRSGVEAYGLIDVGVTSHR